VGVRVRCFRVSGRIRAVAGIGSACGPGASPTPDLRESARAVPITPKQNAAAAGVACLAPDPLPAWPGPVFLCGAPIAPSRSPLFCLFGLVRSFSRFSVFFFVLLSLFSLLLSLPRFGPLSVGPQHKLGRRASHYFCEQPATRLFFLRPLSLSSLFVSLLCIGPLSGGPPHELGRRSHYFCEQPATRLL
jgi:hypothetical protein